MKRWIAITLAVVTAVAVPALGGQTARAQQRNLRELYERARLMEQARDTKEAVRLYTEVVAKAKNDRALTSAAEARLAALTTVKRQDGRQPLPAIYGVTVYCRLAGQGAMGVGWTEPRQGKYYRCLETFDENFKPTGAAWVQVEKGGAMVAKPAGTK
jgi:type II secretory pathway pseudopilin PulG